MNSNQRYAIEKNKVVYRIIDNEAVILNLDNGYYFSLDEVGTKILKAIDNGKNIDEILNCLSEEYQVADERLKKDVTKLLSQLEEVDLIKKIKG